MSKLSNEARTTSLGLLNYAREYLNAYEILKKTSGLNDFSPVLLYLFCHGIELCLKAFLKSEAHSLKELKNIGHDIGKLYVKCHENGLNDFSNFTNQDVNAIVLLNQYYVNKEFEYICVGYKEFPVGLDRTLEIFRNFIQQIERKCAESSKRERKE